MSENAGLNSTRPCYCRARITWFFQMESRDHSASMPPDSLSLLPQQVAAPLTRAAIFLVLKINPGPDARDTVRSFCPDLSAIFRAVDFRDLEGGLSCVMGFGSEAWDQ